MARTEAPALQAVPGHPVVHAITVAGTLRLALTVDEVAALLFGRTDRPACRRVRWLIKGGQLRATSTGASYLIPADSVMKFLDVPAAASA